MRKTWLFFIFIVVSEISVATEQNTRLLFLPKDVVFGATITELAQKRPNIQYDKNTDISTIGLFGAIETYFNDEKCEQSYIYHFKKGKLGAVVYTRNQKNMLDDKKTLDIYRALKRTCKRVSKEKISRKNMIFTVEHWYNKKADLNICLEATTAATVLTFFEPNIFNQNELFPSLENRGKQKALTAGRRQKYSDSINLPIDRLSSDAPETIALDTELESVLYGN